jgi:4a-hydroxytetrahydrobiopterin dehydratase
LDAGGEEMVALEAQSCEACRAGAPRVTDEEKRALGAQVPAWRVVEREGEERIERVFEFPDFRRALDFTNRVGEIAEQEGHHPALLTEWGKVTVAWWTHKIGGLHRNDYVMAAKTDALGA